MRHVGRRERGYSMRLIQAFGRSLARRPAFPSEWIEQLGRSDPDARIPASTAHKLLSAAVEHVGDPLLGLKAGTTVSLGDGGAIDYAMSSAATVRDAIAVAVRYFPLINDAVELRLQIDKGRAFLRLESQVPMPAAAEDFMLCALFRLHLRVLVDSGVEVECWITHPPPGKSQGEPRNGQRAEYELAFSAAALRFDAPACGFCFRADWLDVPLSRADPKLHDVMRAHVDALLADLPTPSNLTQGVRHKLVKELPQGKATARQVARELHMSERTLERRLADEGTTFKALLDDVRRRLALEYLGNDRIELGEIAFLLGFSQPPAFHRAFKRWTGKTPLEYRRGFRS